MHSAALFDLDGTLIDSEARGRAAWTRLFVRHGVPHDAALIASFAGRPGREVIAEHLHAFTGRGLEEVYTEAVSYLDLPDLPEVVAVPGSVELLKRLHAKRIPVGVVTSGTRGYALAELRSLGVLPLLDVVITADDVTRGKPDPEGYLAGCRAVGVAPERTVVFEDAAAGVAAAKAAGTFCVAITTTQPASLLAAADLVLPDLSTVDWPVS